jgi:hypothetical protein
VVDFLVAALDGVDNSSIQLMWTDVTDDINTVYALNGNAINVGKQQFNTTIEFAQRVYMFEFHDIDLGNSSTVENGAILGALVVIQIVLIIATILFIRNRLV